MIAALGQNGVRVGASNPLVQPYINGYIRMSDEILAGWLGVSLLQERRGNPSPKFAEYVAGWPDYNRQWPFTRISTMSISSPSWLMLPTIAPNEWADIQSWPANTCEGAFVKDPRNARFVRLMQGSVGQVPAR